MQPYSEPRLFAGKYRLGKLLGEGGMGAVYEAYHPGLGITVAIKILGDRFIHNDNSHMRFRREARATAAINHPHVVRVMDVGTDKEGVPFIVMEHLQGETLSAKLKRQRQLPLSDALTISTQILSGLGEAHARGVIHRDLKPANIFLTQRKPNQIHIKIVDFGISKFSAHSQQIADITSEGSLLGTPHFMAPEQIQRDQNIDSRADIYAVGVLLYRMLSGRLPFASAAPQDLFRHVMEGRHPPLEIIAPHLPESIYRVVGRAMAHERSCRFQNVKEFLAALKESPQQLSEANSQNAEGLAPHHATKHADDYSASSSITPATAKSTVPSYPVRDSLKHRIKRAAWLAVPLLVTTVVIAWTTWRQHSQGQPVSDKANAPERAFMTPQPIRIAVTRYLPPSLIKEQYVNLLRYLETKLSMPIELKVFEDYLNIANELEMQHFGVVILSPYSYIKAKEQNPHIRLLATPVTRHGGKSYNGFFLARKNSDIRDIGDLRGRVFCYVSPSSTSGYLFPRAVLYQHGINPDKDFRATRFTGDHLSNLRALYSGACDAAAVFQNTLATADQNNIPSSELRIIGSTDKIPNDAYCASSAMPGHLFKKLRHVLLTLPPGSDAANAVLDARSPFLGFVKVHDSDYDTVRAAEKINHTKTKMSAASSH